MTGLPRRLFALGTLLAALYGGPLLTAAPVPKADPKEIDKLLERVPVENLGSTITQPGVAKELQLDDGQTKQLAELWEAIGAELKGSILARKGAANANGSGEDQLEMFASVVASSKEFDTKALKILSPSQIRRLKQIQLQKDGPHALLSRHAIRALNPTVAQEDKMVTELGEWKRVPMIGEFVAIVSLEMQGNAAEADGANRILQKSATDIDDVTAAMLKHLTAEQREKWKQMTGEPISRTELLKAGTAFGDMKLTKVMMEAEAAPQPQPQVVVPAGGAVPPPAAPPPVEKK